MSFHSYLDHHMCTFGLCVCVCLPRPFLIKMHSGKKLIGAEQTRSLRLSFSFFLSLLPSSPADAY